MEFDYNPAKNRANIEKHGIPLFKANEINLETLHIEQDLRKAYSEDRFIGTGYLDRRLHVMIFTPREGKLRVISLRKANKRERKKYEQKI